MSNVDLFSSGESGDEEQPASPEIPLQGTVPRKTGAKESGSESVESDDDPFVIIRRRANRNSRKESVPAVLSDRTNASTSINCPIVKPSQKGKQKENDFNSIAETLTETNKLLLRVSRRMEKFEEKMRHIEDTINNQCSSASSSASSPPTRSRKKVVPLEVRRETRRVYAILLEEDIDNFEGWSIGEGFTYKSPENQRIVSRLVDEVRGLNPNYVTQHIRDAAYRFYRTRCEEHSTARRGLAVEKQKKKRHERIARKLAERTSALQKMKFKKSSDVDLWKKVLLVDMMSSEDSDMDDDEEVLKVNSLPWRADNVTRMFHTLDNEAAKQKTPQSRRQMKRRVVGGISSRSQPTNSSVPHWGLCK